MEQTVREWSSAHRIASKGSLIETDPGSSAEGGPPVKRKARYVSIGEFDDLYFQVLFANRHAAADYDPWPPLSRTLQRQFEDADRRFCYQEAANAQRRRASAPRWQLPSRWPRSTHATAGSQPDLPS